MNHNSSEVRRNAVCCLVSLYFLGGHEFVGYLDQLDPIKRKLVSLYINKEQARRGDVDMKLES